MHILRISHPEGKKKLTTQFFIPVSQIEHVCRLPFAFQNVDHLYKRRI
jgi:hypothetical protein